MKKLLKTFHITVLASLLAVAAPLEGAELKTDIKVNSPTIRLGDLFTDTGHAASVVVDDAPDPGMKKFIPISRLVGIATYYGLEWTAPYNMTRLSVTRAGVVLSEDDLSDLVSEALINEGVDSRFNVNLSRLANKIALPEGYSTADIAYAGLDLNRRTGSFVAAYDVPTGAGDSYRLTLRGRMQEVTAVPVLRRSSGAGTTLTADDIMWMDIPMNRVGRNILLSSDDLVGQATRRPLQANTPLRITDVQRPVLIKKGETVMVRVINRNLAITMTGRALDNGGKGDMIRIVNTSSHQTIEGLVTGAGRVNVLTGLQMAYAGQ